MVSKQHPPRIQHRGLVFRFSGVVMLLAGIGSLALGPVEMVCFTWFEEGGRFAYDGFGFGSFMFGNMAIVFLFILPATKELSVGAGAAVAVLAVLSYVALPGLLVRFYRSRRAQTAFGTLGPHPGVFSRWVESLSVPVLVVVGLEATVVVALHILLFFNGVFPLPGGWATGLPGYVRVDAAILSLLAIGWGTVRRRRGAW